MLVVFVVGKYRSSLLLVVGYCLRLLVVVVWLLFGCGSVTVGCRWSLLFGSWLVVRWLLVDWWLVVGCCWLLSVVVGRGELLLVVVVRVWLWLAVAGLLLVVACGCWLSLFGVGCSWLVLIVLFY